MLVDVVAVTEAVRNVSVVDRMSADLAGEVFISTQRRAPVWKLVPLVASMTRVSPTKVGLPLLRCMFIELNFLNYHMCPIN